MMDEEWRALLDHVRRTLDQAEVSLEVGYRSDATWLLAAALADIETLVLLMRDGTSAPPTVPDQATPARPDSPTG